MANSLRSRGRADVAATTDVLLAGAVIVGIEVVALIGAVSLEVLLRRPEGHIRIASIELGNEGC